MPDTEFIYNRIKTPIGVKVEEVSGGAARSGRVWTLLATQIYQENGREQYRQIDHLENGAPLLCGEDCRISVTHTQGLLAVATLPPTPECALDGFNPRTALGIDAERLDRSQVLKVRDRYLNDEELSLIPPGDLQANITAWTCKEALFKAALTPGLDWRQDYRIDTLPTPGGRIGHASVNIPLYGTVEFILYRYVSEECIVTLAITPQTATYKKN